ncbi:MAG: aspartate/glutamate racemase family protein [Nitrosarchaeum sp.]|nr:aspartate/glutamate racemase family protein [Nitrosarchaeum sp.]
MSRVVVFDSGLGSLSIIREMQKVGKYEIIYFGDQESFPYGKKSKKQLAKIIKDSIEKLREEFSPDLIVMGSNTPTIMLDIKDGDVIGVRPPILYAANISKTKNIGILGTESAVQSRELSEYIKKLNLDSDINVHKINGSQLVGLVESGKFLTNIPLCRKNIQEILSSVIEEKGIDTITLSSTHLPFLRKIMEKKFPSVKFVDPAKTVAEKISKTIKSESKSQLKIFASGDISKFQQNLSMLGIQNKVRPLSI